MRTSKTIKRNQAHPPKILSRNGDSWEVEGRGQDSYTVAWSTVDREMFLCNCEGGRKGYLCRHVQAVTANMAHGKGYTLVQFWTDEAEARRQRRKTMRLKTRSRKFWITYSMTWMRKALLNAGRGDVARVSHARRDRYKPGLWDVYYSTTKGTYARFPVRRVA